MATLAPIACPEKFSFVSADWPKWKKRLEQYLLVSGLSTKTDVERIAALMYFMGERSEDVFSTLTFSDVSHKLKFDKVLSAFENYFVIRRNIVYDRAIFFQRTQKDGETAEDFVTALHTLAEYCKFGTLREEMLRDKIVHGIKNRKVSEKLQLDSALTLEKAILTVRQHETVHQQQDDIRQEKQNPNVDFVKQKTARIRNEYQRARVCEPKSSSNKFKPRGSDGKPPSQPKSCFWCGKEPSHAKEKCPARKTTCHKCEKVGHYARVCKTKPGVRSVSIESVFVGAVGHADQSNKTPWIATVQVNEVPLNFKLDCGADVTILPSTLTHKFKTLVRPTTQILNGPAKSILPTTGEMTVKLKYNSTEITETVFFVNKLTTPLLSRNACILLKIIARIDELTSGSATTVQPEIEFPKLFKGLGKLEEEHTIRLNEGARPVAVSVPRRVAIPLMGQLKQQLDEMVNMEVIVPVDEPTEWCSPMVVVKKPTGKLRICIDLTEVNKNIRRELHPMAAVDYSLGLLGGAKYKSKLDCCNAFWQCPLDKDSQLLTTFITPYGRYCFRRIPYGICSAPEVFQKRISHILRGIPGIVCHMDDIFVGGATMQEHDERLRQVLQRLQDAGLTLNLDKCLFSATKMTFLGHILDEDGIHPDSAKVDAIVNLPQPNNIREVRRFLGLANYLGRFIPHMAETAEPLYALLKNNHVFCWDTQQQNSFNKIKQIVSSHPVLVVYEVNRTTRVSADASSYGLGAVLQQKQNDGSFRPVAFASRTLSAAEKKYVQIEREALAFTWACEKFRDFLTGLHFEIETDHKPLVPIFTTKLLDDLTPRLQRFRLRMMSYSFSIFYTPGKDLIVADILSRSPLAEIGDPELEEETAAYVHTVISSLPTSDELLQKIWCGQQNDPVLVKVTKYCADGWPQHVRDVDSDCKPFFPARHEISVEDGLLLRGQRIIIPFNMQSDIMERLHCGHPGVTKTRAKARASVWWPNLSQQIATCVQKCQLCIKERPTRKEPLLPSAFPQRPWQKVSMDLFHLNGKCYLLICDQYSRYPEIALLERQTAECVILHCKSVFSRHGIPDCVMSDNGPQFGTLAGSNFTQFAKSYGFCHQTSSPRYPQSDGFAEAAVKSVKSCLKKSTDPYLGLLAYRSTPLANGFSPAELLMGRKLRTTVPVTPTSLNPKEVPINELRGKEEKRRDNQKRNFDRHHGVYKKEDPDDGEVVWIRDLRTWGTVKQKAPQPRSFIIQTIRGEVRRNLVHLTRARTHELPTEASKDEDNLLEMLEDEAPAPEQPRRRGQRRQIPPPAAAAAGRPRRAPAPVQRLNYERLGQPSV